MFCKKIERINVSFLTSKFVSFQLLKPFYYCSSYLHPSAPAAVTKMQARKFPHHLLIYIIYKFYHNNKNPIATTMKVYTVPNREPQESLKSYPGDWRKPDIYKGQQYIYINIMLFLSMGKPHNMEDEMVRSLGSSP